MCKQLTAKLKKLPIIRDLSLASKDHWVEATTELGITVFFGLMPVWLGCFIIGIIEIPDTPVSFIKKFASSSDLALLSASFIGPLLYMMFGVEKLRHGVLSLPFPSGFWFLILIFFCCLIATVIYCFTYVSETGVFFDSNGAQLKFTKENSVMVISFALFFSSIILLLSASVIRNSMTNSVAMMSNNTSDFVDDFKLAQTTSPTATTVAEETQDFVTQMQADQGATDVTRA